jgi:glycosyltransferase involved in cell wall biosynthesis
LTAVTLLCADLSTNALSRTALLAEILAGEADVRIVGTRFDKHIWPPATELKIPVVDIGGARWPRYLTRMKALRELLNGDVVIARKPLLSSFGIALGARRRTGVPVILDIDDDELAFRQPRGRYRLTSLSNPNSRLTTVHYTRRIHEADALLVASSGLQRRFGGVLVPHAKNTDALRPQPELRTAARQQLGLTARHVVMFMGTPRPHKGVEDAAAAMRLMKHSEVVLVVVGAENDDYSQALRQKFPHVEFRPPYSMKSVGLLLQAADVVVVPQRDSAAARDQVPAKLLDAMAVAKPAVGTAVSDIPEMLADGRGWVVPPRDPAALAHALDSILADPAAAARAGQRAREWVIANASYNSVRGTILATIHAAIDRGTQPR